MLTVSGQVASAQTAPNAQQTAQFAFAIPTQSLSSALTLFARQAGLQVSVDSTLVAGHDGGVEGSMAASEALRRLLTGSGLTFRFTDGHTVIVEKQAADGTLNLSPLTVEGQGNRETATGPVSGYVASRSLTGTKTDTPISETPQAISVVTRDQMNAQAAQNVGEALAYTAGVGTGSKGDSSSLAGDNVSIRGFGGDGTAGASDNEYVDGLRLLGTNYVTSGLDQYLYERIEVLKGPTSVLYGQNTPGGIVNAVSKRPTATPFHEVQLQVGSYDRVQGAFDLSGPADADGRVLYRLTGLTSTADAQTDYTGLDRQAIAPAVTLLGDRTSLTILTSYQHDNATGRFVNSVPAAGSVLSNPNGKISSSFYAGDPNFDGWDRSYYGLGYQLEHQLDSTWTLRQNARYSRNDMDMKSVYSSSLQANQRVLNRAAYAVREHSDAYTVDNQAEAKFSTGLFSHTALVGVDYQEQSSSTIRRYGTAPSLDIYAPVYYQGINMPGVWRSATSSVRQLGGYAQDQIKLEKWILTLGGRQDWATSQTFNRLAGVKSQSNNDHAFTGRVGLGYQFDNGITPYLSYSESFQPSTDTDYTGKGFDPLTADQYEAGVKYQPPGSNSSVTMSAFQLTEQNVTTSDPYHVGESVQTGEIRSQGLELEGKASLSDNLDLTAAYSFLNPEVTKSNDVDLGKRPVGVAKHSASVWADYTIHAGDLSGLGFGGGVRYVGETAGNSDNSLMVPAFTLLDAAMHYDLSALNRTFEGWSFALNAKNLLDKDYVASCDSSARCYYGLRRSVIGTLRYRW